MVKQAGENVGSVDRRENETNGRACSGLYQLAPVSYVTAACGVGMAWHRDLPWRGAVDVPLPERTVLCVTAHMPAIENSIVAVRV